MSSAPSTRPDLTLILDAEGLIEEAIAGASLVDEDLEAWIGQRWDTTVADVGPTKVRRLLETARDQRVCGFSQINQRLPSGRELLMEFSAVRSDTEHCGIVAIGKNLGLVVEQQQKLLATQQNIEREYWKLRDIESRYRAMITSTSEAVVLVREDDLTIVEVNAQARQLLNLNGDSVKHATLEFGADTVRVVNMLREIRRAGEAPSTLVHLGPNREAWRVKATMVSGMQEQHFLLQFSRTDGGMSALTVPAMAGPSREGFVIIDADGFVQMANEPFAELAGTPDASTLIGRHIGTWFKTLNVDEVAASAGIQTVELRDSVYPERKQPVKMSVCDLKVVEEGGMALMIEALTPVTELH